MSKNGFASDSSDSDDQSRKYRLEMEKEMGIFGPYSSDFEFESDDSIPPLRDIQNKLLLEKTRAEILRPIPVPILSRKRIEFGGNLTLEEEHYLKSLQNPNPSGSSVRFLPQSLRYKKVATRTLRSPSYYRKTTVPPRGLAISPNGIKKRGQSSGNNLDSSESDEHLTNHLGIEKEMGLFGPYDSDFEYESDDSIPSLTDVQRKLHEENTAVAKTSRPKPEPFKILKLTNPKMRPVQGKRTHCMTVSSSSEDEVICYSE